MMEEDSLSSTWPSAAVGRRQSSTLFHRTTGSSTLDVTSLRAAHDEEWGGGQEQDTVQDEDCLTPPRGQRRIYSKRGAGISTARRNGALCLALCVSVASLLWIITRDAAGAPAGGLGTLGVWPDILHPLGKRQIPITEGSEWTPVGLKEGAGVGGHHHGSHPFLRGATEYNKLREQMKHPTEPSQQHRNKFKRWQLNQQQQQQQQQQQEEEEVASTIAHFHASGAGANLGAITNKAMGPSKQQLEAMVLEARSDPVNSARASPGRGIAERAKREAGANGWRDATGGARPFFGRTGARDGEGAPGAARGEGDAVLRAKRDAEGVGKWGLFEEVPIDTIDDQLDFEVRDAAFERAVTAPKDSRPLGDTHRVSRTREGLLPSGKGWEREPGGEIANVGAAALAGGGGDGGVVSNDYGGGAGEQMQHVRTAIERAAMSESPQDEAKVGRGLNQGGEGESSEAKRPGEAEEANETDQAEGLGEQQKGTANGLAPESEEAKVDRKYRNVEAQREMTEPVEVPSVYSVPSPADSGSANLVNRGKEGGIIAPADGARGAVRSRRTEGDATAEQEIRESRIRNGRDEEAVEMEGVLEGQQERNHGEGGKDGGALPPGPREEVINTGGGEHGDAAKKGTGDVREGGSRSVEDSRMGREAPSTKVKRSTADKESKQASVERGELVVSAERAERADVKPPSRNAARWEQARASGNNMLAATALASSAAVAAARESAALAKGVAAPQPPTQPFPEKIGEGTTHELSRRSGGGAQAGAEGAAMPCRLEGRVEDWQPPATADIRSSYRWKDEQKGSMDKIRRFNHGGIALRDLIHAEVVRLDILRHDLFC